MIRVEQEDRLLFSILESSVGQILAHIEQFPLLNPQEEKAVAEEYACAKTMAQTATNLAAVLSIINSEAMSTIFNKGHQARQRLICCNMRLVFNIAKKYRRKYEEKNLPLEDLFQEGAIGLMRAVDKFDPAKDLRFSTYAVWWIKQEIKRYIQNNGMIRVPIHQQILIEDHEKSLASSGKSSLSVQQIARLVEAYNASQIIDLDSLTFEDGTPLNNSYELDTQIFDLLFSEFEIEDLKDVMEENLTAREQLIIELFFGFHKNQELSSKEIESKFGITKARILEIRNTALKKILRYLKLQGMATYKETFDVV